MSSIVPMNLPRLIEKEESTVHFSTNDPSPIRTEELTRFASQSSSFTEELERQFVEDAMREDGLVQHTSGDLMEPLEEERRRGLHGRRRNSALSKPFKPLYLFRPKGNQEWSMAFDKPPQGAYTLPISSSSAQGSFRAPNKPGDISTNRSKRFLFVDCGFQDTVIYLYDSNGSRVSMEYMHVTHENALGMALGNVKHPHVETDCMGGLEVWITSLLRDNNTIPSEEIKKTTHLIVVANSGLMKLETRMQRPDVITNVSNGILELLKKKLHLQQGVLVFETFEIISLHKEAQYEITAAKYLLMGHERSRNRNTAAKDPLKEEGKSNELSSLISIGSNAFQATSIVGEQAVLSIPVGSMTVKNSGIPREKLWQDKIALPLTDFKFGPRPVFISGFIYSTKNLQQYLVTRDLTHYAEVLERALKAPVPLDELQMVFSSPYVYDFIASDRADRTQVTAYMLQQTLMCGSYPEGTEVLICNRFMMDGRPQKITFSLGWCLERERSKGNVPGLNRQTLAQIVGSQQIVGSPRGKKSSAPYASASAKAAARNDKKKEQNAHHQDHHHHHHHHHHQRQPAPHIGAMRVAQQKETVPTITDKTTPGRADVHASGRTQQQARQGSMDEDESLTDTLSESAFVGHTQSMELGDIGDMGDIASHPHALHPHHEVPPVDVERVTGHPPVNPKALAGSSSVFSGRSRRGTLPERTDSLEDEIQEREPARSGGGHASRRREREEGWEDGAEEKEEAAQAQAQRARSGTSPLPSVRSDLSNPVAAKRKVFETAGGAIDANPDGVRSPPNQTAHRSPSPPRNPHRKSPRNPHKHSAAATDVGVQGITSNPRVHRPGSAERVHRPGSAERAARPGASERQGSAGRGGFGWTASANGARSESAERPARSLRTQAPLGSHKRPGSRGRQEHVGSRKAGAPKSDAEEREIHRKLFDELDVDGGGTVEADELAAKFNMSIENAVEIIRSLGGEEAEVLDFEMFHTWMKED